MLDIDTKVLIHHLTIHPSAKLIAERKQKVGEDKRAAINEEVGKLADNSFII